MKDLILSEIWIYPVKSLGGIRLTSAKVMEKGLLHDRRWMLIDENNIFMTQRAHPVMALFKPAVDTNRLTITKKNAVNNQSSISLDINTSSLGASFKCKIWDDEVEVCEVDPLISEWFSIQMGMTCKLVSFPEENSRPVDARYKINNEQVSLADAYPFLIIGQSTLDHLNSKLQEALPMDRFRPNFVFTGGEPHDEDNWREFSIGKTRFVGVKLCARCPLPTVNQETAEKGIEPLLTLSTYRKRENKVLFGQNLVALDHYEVSVGDKITVN
jgi:uncharacterized protein YcbX